MTEQQHIENMPFQQYLAVEALSASGMKRLERSPAHYKTPLKDSKTFKFGRAFHSYVLQPELFCHEYYIYPESIIPKFDKRKPGEKELSQKIDSLVEEESKGKETITEAEFSAIQRMSDSLITNKTASELIQSQGICELSLFWNDFQFGMPCKCRLDKLVTDTDSAFNGCIIDLKTTDDAKNFVRSIASYKYHWQAAWDLIGASTVFGYPFKRFIFIAIEKEPPHGVMCHELDERILSIAAEQFNSVKSTYYDCLKTGIWGCYPDMGVNYIKRLPKYAEYVDGAEYQEGIVYDF